MRTSSIRRCRDNHRSDDNWFSCELQTSAGLIEIHQQHPEQFPFLLETAVDTHGQHRYSMLFAGTDETPISLSLEQLQAADQKPFLKQLDSAYLNEQQSDSSGLPFIGGWFLLLGYELAAQVEPSLELGAPAQAQPVAMAWRCDAAIIIDHQQKSRCLIAESRSRLNELRTRVEQTPAFHSASIVSPEWQIQADSGEDFCNGVRRIQEYIRAGDVFQVNLSRGWHAVPDQKEVHDQAFGVEIYRALRQANAAPFAGMARFNDSVLLSSSPERLLEIDNSWVQTRPIAGTRPRGRNAADDLRLSRELLNHPKERAEHIMLIDLERNDLGRVCVPGSIEVDELMVQESYSSVHHIVSNVRGKLRPEINPGQAIAAIFPGGTITGCPKVRCMEIIAELENTGRGLYTGAMGYLSRHGRLDLNILIRSMLWQNGSLHWRTGCGIVADSVAADELSETEHKAAGILQALTVIGQSGNLA